MKETYFNLLNIFEFQELQDNEQKKVLIDLEIYIIGKSYNVDYSFDDLDFQRGSSQYPKFLGSDIEYDGDKYKLNDEFLDEVFNIWKTHFIEKTLKLIDSNIKTAKLQIEFSDENYLTDLENKIKAAYKEKLSKKLFQELHLSKNESDEKHYEILKKFLKFNWYDLSDYIFGLKNISSYQISDQYYTFIYCIKHIELINSFIQESHKTKNEKDENLTITQKVMFLERLIAADGGKIISLTSYKKAKIYSLIFSNNEDNVEKAIIRFEKNEEKSKKALKKDFEKINDIFKSLGI